MFLRLLKCMRAYFLRAHVGPWLFFWSFRESSFRWEYMVVLLWRWPDGQYVQVSWRWTFPFCLWLLSFVWLWVAGDPRNNCCAKQWKSTKTSSLIYMVHKIVRGPHNLELGRVLALPAAPTYYTKSANTGCLGGAHASEAACQHDSHESDI